MTIRCRFLDLGSFEVIGIVDLHMQASIIILTLSFAHTLFKSQVSPLLN